MSHDELMNDLNSFSRRLTGTNYCSDSGTVGDRIKKSETKEAAEFIQAR